MSERISCDNCVYWESGMAVAKDDNYGWCVRYAPRPIATAEHHLENVIANWPITEGVNRCGEFKSAWSSES